MPQLATAQAETYYIACRTSAGLTGTYVGCWWFAKSIKPTTKRERVTTLLALNISGIFELRDLLSAVMGTLALRDRGSNIEEMLTDLREISQSTELVGLTTMLTTMDKNDVFEPDSGIFQVYSMLTCAGRLPDQPS